MPVLELDRVPSKAELTEGIDVPPDPRPYYKSATGFRRGERVEEGKPFPGTNQVVKGLGVLSGLESQLVSVTGAPVTIVAYLEGANPDAGIVHAGIGSKNGLPDETIRDLAAGPFVSPIRVARNGYNLPARRVPEPVGAGGGRR